MHTYTKKDQTAIFEAVKFCALAMDHGKDSRFDLDVLRLEEGKIVGCDGHRLHIAEVDHGLEPGAYEVIENKAGQVRIIRKATAGEYPDYTSIVAHCNGNHVRFLPFVSSKEAYQPYTEVVRAMAPEITLRFKYVQDAVSAAGHSFAVHGSGPVALKSGAGNFQAYIMPAAMGKY